MFDRGEFWSAPPAWAGAQLHGAGVRIEALDIACVLQLSGAVDAALAQVGIAGIHGPRELCEASRYALRLAPDSALLVDTAPTGDRGESAALLQPGWHADGAAISDLSDGILCVEITGPRARELLALGTEYPFESAQPAPQESARLLFAGLRVAVARRADGWRLHVERAWAPALWHWLAAHVEWGQT